MARNDSTTTSTGDDVLSLQEAADELGVHYMTAYRYLRTGRLDGVKDGAEWRVPRASLEQFQQAEPVKRGRANRNRRYDELLVPRLLDGDEPGAWEVLQQALVSGYSPEDVYFDIIAVALREVGAAWRDGRIDVADEHVASAMTHRLLGRMGPLFARRGRKRGTVVLAAPPGDHHALPTALLADPLRGRGFAVVDLGANTPSKSIMVAAGQANRLVAVGVCATSPRNDDGIADAVAAVHRVPGARVVLGGEGVGPVGRAERFGADRLSTSAREAIDHIEALAASARTQAKGA